MGEKWKREIEEKETEETETVNPGARRDRPGTARDDLADSEKPREEPPKGFQDADLDPRDQGGITD